MVVIVLYRDMSLRGLRRGSVEIPKQSHVYQKVASSGFTIFATTREVEMIVNIFYFILGVLAPYAAEQVAYSKLIPAGGKEGKDVKQSYGWRIVWDASHFTMLISAGYRVIAMNDPLSQREWLGYVCFLLGVALRIWSLKELGRFYDSGIALKADHQIVQSGPYRVLRHPLHIGTVLQIGGLAGFAPVWLGVPVVVASLAVCVYLNRTEDRTHAERFSSSFKSYYLETWDIVDLIFWKRRR